MRRKLTLAVLLSLSTASSQALALGVGEVDVRSSLNAPLRAVIPLTDTTGLDPQLLRVRVADPGEFESAGLVRTALAASVQADVEVRQGQWVVTLASERAVREPWMDLMLRFDWPSGRQLREVTLLLDPPNYDSMPVLVSGSGRRPTPSVTTDEARVASAETAAPGTAPASMESRAQAEERAWIGSGDTLWSVAGRLRPDSGVSMNQMMVALVEANPDVFPSGNINAMRAGHTLAVPPRDAIAARSAAEASRIVQAMNQAWASRGNGRPERIALQPSAAAGDDIEVAAAQAVAEPSATPTLPESIDQGEGLATPAGESDSTPRLTLLSDEELAAETAGQGASGAGAAEVEADGALDAGVLATLGAGALALGEGDPRFAFLEQRWQEQRAALEDVRAERDALQQELGGLRDEVEAMREQLAMLLAGGAGAQGVGDGNAVVQSEADDRANAPWWGAMYPVSYDRNLILGGAGLVALLGLWLWVRRRQRRGATAAMGSAAMSSMVHGMPPSSAAMPPSAPPPMGPGMGVSSAEAQQGDTARPAMPQAEAISEADIFMAYGRYDQAKELLEASLAGDPGRHDLRLKLLGVHVEQGNWQAAEEEMQTLAETGDSGLLAEATRLLAKRHGVPGDAAGGAPEDTPAADAQGQSPRSADSDLPDAGAAQVGEASGDGGEEAARDPALSYAAFPEHELPGERHASPAEAPAEAPAVDGRQERDENPTPPAEAPVPEPPSQRELPPRPEPEEARIEWDVIDYQPPALDPKPAPRVETPMQPSVDFPRMAGDGDGHTQRDERESPVSQEPAEDAEAEWEVEEVAFPPLDPDNGSALGETDRRDDLAEARRLLANGETERARPLLQRLLDRGEEPGLRDEARALFTHYRL